MSTTAKVPTVHRVALGEIPPKYESAVFKNEPTLVLSTSDPSLPSSASTPPHSETAILNDPASDFIYEWIYPDPTSGIIIFIVAIDC